MGLFVLSISFMDKKKERSAKVLAQYSGIDVPDIPVQLNRDKLFSSGVGNLSAAELCCEFGFCSDDEAVISDRMFGSLRIGDDVPVPVHGASAQNEYCMVSVRNFSQLVTVPVIRVYSKRDGEWFHMLPPGLILSIALNSPIYQKKRVMRLFDYAEASCKAVGSYVSSIWIAVIDSASLSSARQLSPARVTIIFLPFFSYFSAIELIASSAE